MRLRWFSVIDIHGNKTSPVLQYWNEKIERWEAVKYIDCDISQFEDFMQSYNRY